MMDTEALRAHLLTEIDTPATVICSEEGVAKAGFFLITDEVLELLNQDGEVVLRGDWNQERN